MIYIVLGMHKSGTSLISRMFHESGINMGTFDKKIDYYNGQKYERSDIHNVIVKMLNVNDVHSLDTIPPFEEKLIQKNLPLFINILCTCDSNYDHWGFKNPRTIFIYNFIKPFLSDHKLICIYRNLDGVLSHYFQYINYNLKYLFKVIKAWKIYNEKMTEIIEKAEVDFILLNYEKLMSNSKQIKRLESFLNLQLKDCRSKNKKRSPGIYKKKISKYISRLLILFNVMELKKISNKLVLIENGK
ncbi:MAG: sulfotransferase [Promethearchaeota archaeon]